MWRLLCLSITSLALAACSDGAATCGPGSAADTLDVTGGGATLTFANFTGSPNADCGVTPVVSVTIEGKPADGTLGFLTFCVPRPDKLGGGLTFDSDFQLPSASIMSAGCTYTLDAATPPTGTAKSAGLCDNGKSKAGFALTVNAQFALSRMCGTTTDSVPVTIAGTVAVAGPP